MINYLSTKELDELGLATVSAYNHIHTRKTSRCVDVEGLAESMGLTILYEAFAEDDNSKIGFLADGRTPLYIKQSKDRVAVIFPENTIVIEIGLRRSEQSGRRRFTIAHELSHHILNLHNPIPEFCRDFDMDEQSYDIAQLRKQMTFSERQADRLASSILMPEFLVIQALNDHNNGAHIKMYGRNITSPEDNTILAHMAAQLGVSISALKIRLRELSLTDPRPLEEYVENRFLKTDKPEYCIYKRNFHFYD